MVVEVQGVHSAVPPSCVRTKENMGELEVELRAAKEQQQQAEESRAEAEKRQKEAEKRSFSLEAQLNQEKERIDQCVCQ